MVELKIFTHGSYISISKYFLVAMVSRVATYILQTLAIYSRTCSIIDVMFVPISILKSSSVSGNFEWLKNY